MEEKAKKRKPATQTPDGSPDRLHQHKKSQSGPSHTKAAAPSSKQARRGKKGEKQQSSTTVN